MPMYEVDRAEQGVFYKTYRVFADCEEDALDCIFEDEIEPQSEYFKQYDCDTSTTQLRDCDCDICKRRGPWACRMEPDDEA